MASDQKGSRRRIALAPSDSFATTHRTANRETNNTTCPTRNRRASLRVKGVPSGLSSAVQRAPLPKWTAAIVARVSPRRTTTCLYFGSPALALVRFGFSPIARTCSRSNRHERRTRRAVSSDGAVRSAERLPRSQDFGHDTQQDAGGHQRQQP